MSTTSDIDFLRAADREGILAPGSGTRRYAKGDWTLGPAGGRGTPRRGRRAAVEHGGREATGTYRRRPVPARYRGHAGPGNRSIFPPAPPVRLAVAPAPTADRV